MAFSCGSGRIRLRTLCRPAGSAKRQTHFYVGGKTFAGCGEEDGEWGFGCKVGFELQSLLIERPGITVAKYVGRYGWISVEESALQDDAELGA
jgi:hypothetical protein